MPLLSLAVYRFAFRVAEALAWPAYPRSLWHRVFGNAQRLLACVAPGGRVVPAAWS